MTVVGIGIGRVEIPPKNGYYLQGIHTTPAFAGYPAFAELLASAERRVPERGRSGRPPRRRT